MTPIELLAALHAALDSAYATALDAQLTGHGRVPTLPDRSSTPAKAQQHIDSVVRGLLEQDFAARF